MTGNYGGEVLRSIRAFKPVEQPPGLIPGRVLYLSRTGKADVREPD